MAGILSGKTCIITGASSGIGLATARLALNYGARVFGVDISAPPQALDGEENFRGLQIDLASPGAAEETVKQAQQHLGEHISVLANVAGVVDNFGSLDSLTDASLSRCLAINLVAPINLSRAVIASMRQHKQGSIINVSSKAGTSGACAGVAYTASKHGLIGATRQIAWRYRQEGIRCNAIAPGGVSTGITQNFDFSKVDPDGWATLEPVFKANNPQRDKGIGGMEASDVAESICFLASENSKHISGVVLPVDDAWCVM